MLGGVGAGIVYDTASAVRDMVRTGGVPDKVAMSISDHKTRSVFDHYDIVDEADLEEIARRHAYYVQSPEGAAKGYCSQAGVSYR